MQARQLPVVFAARDGGWITETLHNATPLLALLRRRSMRSPLTAPARGGYHLAEGRRDEAEHWADVAELAPALAGDAGEMAGGLAMIRAGLARHGMSQMGQDAARACTIAPLDGRWQSVGRLLTKAELRVLRLLASHLSFPEIGARLQVSTSTVKTQALAIYRKLGVPCRSGAVARGRSVGLIDG